MSVSFYLLSTRLSSSIFEAVRSAIPNEANLACEQEAGGDGRVDVCTADVRNRPDNRSHAETKRQRNLDNVGRLVRIELGTRAATDDDQEKDAEKFDEQRLPELDGLDVLQTSRRHFL